jgi:glycosyltransferase involved in cell wall biosynthesis
MIIAHLGPPPGRQGGPSGYLAQLKRALDVHGAGEHHVLFPPGSDAQVPARRRPGALRSWLRRARLTWAASPAFTRPTDEELQRSGGPIDRLIANAWAEMEASAAASIDVARADERSVLFAHDPAAAAQALQRRRPGHQVWLFLHAPMPHALYLAWCWGVPERRWEDVVTCPDVQAWMARELRIIDDVDRVWLPCREAGEEWTRIDSRFEPALGRASYLLTGAAAPAPSAPPSTRARLRARWGLPPDVAALLFLGNNQSYRGLDLLIRALDHLPGVREVPGVIAVAGMREDALPLHPRLKALGHVDEVGDLLAAVDAIVNVNRFSLFDLSTIEALQAGLPLLVTPVGGNRAFRDLGAGCLLFDDPTPDAIARGLVSGFQMSKGERQALGRRSRACYDTHLTLRHLRDRHVAAYDAALTPLLAS